MDDRPELIDIFGGKYYVSNDLYKYDVAYFNKVNKNIRSMITIYKIPSEYCKYAYIKGGIWTESHSDYPRACLLINEIWVKENVPLFMKKNNIENNEDIENLYEARLAPEVLVLNDNEKFKDPEGNIMKIKMRGERNSKKCYFSVKDIEKCFNMNNLQKTIMHVKSSYEHKRHYEFFTVEKKGRAVKKYSKEMYLTYLGFVKMLFISKNDIVEYFQEWAIEILFIHQFGNTEQKDKLISKLKGIPYESIQELFNISAKTLPCIYLTLFGTVKSLRESMAIDSKYNDNDMVFKFGLTKSFEQRNSKHKSEYKELNIDMTIVQFVMIDALYLFDAEKKLKDTMKNYKLEYKDHNELVVLSVEELEKIKREYKILGNEFSGHTAELNNQMHEYQKQFEEKIKQNDELINKTIIEKMQMELTYVKEHNKEKMELIMKINELEKELLKK